MTPKQVLYQEITNAIKNQKEILSIVGAFGDVDNSEGYIKEVSEPPDGGRLVTFFGCSFIWKGWPDNKIVEGLGLAKAMVSVFPRAILADSWPLRLFLIFMILFRRKKLIHYFHVYSTMIYGHVTEKIAFDPNKYNRCIKELRRAFNETLDIWDKKILTRSKEVLAHKGKATNYDEKDVLGKFEDRKLIMALSQMGEFFWLFLEHDSAYRFPTQDIFAKLDKEALKKDARKEILRLFDLCISRATEHGILHKAIQMRKLVSLALLNKDVREFLKDMLLAVNIDHVRLDQDDWYFCLKKRGFNFKGWPLARRLALKKKLDKERHHYRLQLMDIQMPNEPMIRGFKIVDFDDENDIYPERKKKDEQQSLLA